MKATILALSAAAAVALLSVAPSANAAPLSSLAEVVQPAATVAEKVTFQFGYGYSNRRYYGQRFYGQRFYGQRYYGRRNWRDGNWRNQNRNWRRY